jgi:hypothetical protein
MNKQITVVGIVKEIGGNWRFPGVSIVTENQKYVVTMNPAGKDLLYEVGNKVEVTGIITEMKDGTRRISITGYKVFEMEDDVYDYYSLWGDGFRPYR